MPIKLLWNDTHHHVLIAEFSGHWTWKDFHKAVEDGMVLIRSEGRTVHVVVQTAHSKGMPNGTPFPHLGGAVTNAPCNTGMVIVITQRRFVKVAVSVVNKMYNTSDRFVTVDDMRQAEELLSEHIGVQMYVDRLIDALQHSDQLVVDRALEVLREHDWLYNGALEGANLEGAALYETDLFLAALHRVNLDKADLRRANLFKVDLSESRLRGTDLSGASLVEANLHGADLRLADLRSTNLHMAVLHGADLHYVRCDPHTILPDGSAWNRQVDLRAFTDLDHPQYWYTRGHTEDETLPTRPAGLDDWLRDN